MKRIIRKLKSLLLGTPSQKEKKVRFVADAESKVSKRTYESYDEYLSHQAEKLTKKFDAIQAYDQKYEEEIFLRYKDKINLKGKSVLCIAARLGGEVRAFKRLGALAIGIDIEPGKDNRHVVYGDFHKLDFPDEVFDYAFTNAMDHVLYPDVFLSETARVLKPGGIFINELGIEKPSAYEVIDTSSHEPLIEQFKKFFVIDNAESIAYNIDFVNWNGVLYHLQKKF